LDAALLHSPCGQSDPWSGEESILMAKQTQQPGPGRSTSAEAFDDLRKDIAQRNEQAQKKARKIRDRRDRAQILARRQRDAL
jgi:hypothetical protein